MNKTIVRYLKMRKHRSIGKIDLISIFLIYLLLILTCELDSITIDVKKIQVEKADVNNMFIFHQETKNWAFNKSIVNMLGYYRTELKGLVKGKNIVGSIPLGTRKRFIDYGILKKFGTKFELTDIGREMLLVSE